MTKVHKIQSKLFNLERGRRWCDVLTDVRKYGRTDGRTGVTLNDPAIVLAGK